MNQIIEKLAAAGHLSDEQVKRVESRVSAFIKAAENDPKLMVDAQEKLSGVWDAMKQTGQRFGRGFGEQVPAVAANLAALALVGGTAGAVSDAFRSIRESKDKAKAYKNMMQESGDRLAGIPAKQIQQGFNTLHTTNPAYASDPVVAAEFIRETSRSEAYPFQILKLMREGRELERPTDFRLVMSPLKGSDLREPEAKPGPGEQVAREKELLGLRTRAGLEGPAQQVAKEKKLHELRIEAGLKKGPVGAKGPFF